ncbi:MAG TPA: substrate-binding domain-containing protein, partial [Rubrivivax sp.]|nr:substrate-binding domain-containing protein [Rubrivivax sp.]
IVARAVGNYEFDLAAQATLEMFTHGSPADRPDALFVASDHMAFAAMDTLRGALGLRIPEDVSVVGFDNVQQAEWGAYRLTTVEQNVSQMIEATVKMLLQQLEDDAVTRDHAVIPARLVVRSSARVPATGALA